MASHKYSSVHRGLDVFPYLAEHIPHVVGDCGLCDPWELNECLHDLRRESFDILEATGDSILIEYHFQ